MGDGFSDERTSGGIRAHIRIPLRGRATRPSRRPDRRRDQGRIWSQLEDEVRKSLWSTR